MKNFFRKSRLPSIALGVVSAAALMGAASSAQAHTSLSLGIGLPLYSPAPVYYAPPPPPPPYYYGYAPYAPVAYYPAPVYYGGGSYVHFSNGYGGGRYWR